MSGRNDTPTLEQESPENQSTRSDLPWWFRYLRRIVCVLGGIISGIIGIFGFITLHALCIASAVFQVAISLLLVMMEAPCCCQCVDFIDKIAQFSERRRPLHKGVLYCLLPITPIAMCPGVTSVIGGALVFIGGLTYLYEAVGKKASRDDMLRAARSDKSNLVDNAAPMSQTSPNQVV